MSLDGFLNPLLHLKSIPRSAALRDGAAAAHAAQPPFPAQPLKYARLRPPSLASSPRSLLIGVRDLAPRGCLAGSSASRLSGEGSFPGCRLPSRLRALPTAAPPGAWGLPLLLLLHPLSTSLVSASHYWAPFSGLTLSFLVPPLVTFPSLAFNNVNPPQPRPPWHRWHRCCLAPHGLTHWALCEASCPSAGIFPPNWFSPGPAPLIGLEPGWVWWEDRLLLWLHPTQEAPRAAGFGRVTAVPSTWLPNPPRS